MGRTVARPLAWPPGCRAIVVGGATLGGTGKTPLAIACAAHLAASGARTAFVGHGYRATPGRARIVDGDEPVDLVGDEALVAAAQLARLEVGRGRESARVIVAPTRAEAVGLAATLADVLVVDGLTQASPVRAALALLAVDAVHPWGRARAVPPHGDMRAPVSVLVAACDAIVPLVDRAFGEGAELGSECDLGHMPNSVSARSAFGAGRSPRPLWPALVGSRGVWLRAGASRPLPRTTNKASGTSGARSGEENEARRARVGGRGELVSWSRLGGLRVGLLVAVARPDRIVRFLGRRGVSPRAIVRMPDHGPFDARTRREWCWADAAHRIDLWLASDKCALHIERVPIDAPLGVIDHNLALAPDLVRVLEEIAAHTPQSRHRTHERTR